MRMGSVTHNFDMDQRFMNLDVPPRLGAGTLGRRRAGQRQRGAARLLHAVPARRQGRALGGVARCRSNGHGRHAAADRSRAGPPPRVHGRRRHAQLDRRDRRRRRHRVPRAPLDDAGLHALGRQPDRDRHVGHDLHRHAAWRPAPTSTWWSRPTPRATPSPASREEPATVAAGHERADRVDHRARRRRHGLRHGRRDRQRGRRPRRELASSSGSTARTSARPTRARPTPRTGTPPAWPTAATTLTAVARDAAGQRHDVERRQRDRRQPPARRDRPGGRVRVRGALRHGGERRVRHGQRGHDLRAPRARPRGASAARCPSTA